MPPDCNILQHRERGTAIRQLNNEASDMSLPGSAATPAALRLLGFSILLRSSPLAPQLISTPALNLPRYLPSQSAPCLFS